VLAASALSASDAADLVWMPSDVASSVGDLAADVACRRTNGLGFSGASHARVLDQSLHLGKISRKAQGEKRDGSTGMKRGDPQGMGGGYSHTRPPLTVHTVSVLAAHNASVQTGAHISAHNGMRIDWVYTMCLGEGGCIVSRFGLS
jgi:hypothetical protein